jgi:short-subunit dehydrogenase
LDEKPVIIVTGASSGIGAATARLFGQKGYRVVLAARRLDRLQALQDQIRSAGGLALAVATDVSRPEEIPNLVETTLNEYGQIDILFNNAGFGRLGWLESLDPEKDVQALFQVNVLGVVLLTQAVLPHMISRRSGHIINMSSVAGLIASPTYTIYAASKFAVRGFSNALRREVGIYGIRVSVVCPGGTDTEFRQHTGAQRRTGVTTPGFLRLDADDVARAVLGLTQHPRRLLIIPWTMKLAVWFNALFPGIVDWFTTAGFVRRERKGS